MSNHEIKIVKDCFEFELGDIIKVIHEQLNEVTGRVIDFSLKDKIFTIDASYEYESQIYNMHEDCFKIIDLIQGGNIAQRRLTDET